MITQKVYATDIEDRIDPHFYKHKYLEVATRLKRLRTPAKRVDSFSNVICGPFGSAIKVNDYTDKGVPLIRIENIDKTDGVSSTNATFIKEKLVSSLRRYVVNKGDLVISQRGTLGLSGVIKDDLDGAVISANLIAIKNLKEVTPDYLQFFFNSNLGKIQLERRTSGQVQTKITTEDIKTLLVPIPPKEIQQKIVNTYLSAIKNRKEKLKQADELLNSIEGYVRQQLGINYKEPEEKPTFTTLSNEVDGKRLDPKKYSQKPKAILTAIKKSKYSQLPLKELIIANLSGEWGNDLFDKNTKDGIRIKVLRNTNFDNSLNLNLDDVAERLIEKNRFEKSKLQDGDILIEKSGGSPIQPVGRVAIFDNIQGDYCFSNFLQCIRVNTTKCLPYYLFVYLKTIYALNYMEYLQNQTTGIKNLIWEEFTDIPIALPPKDIQEKLAEEVKDRMSQAINLRKEAGAVLEEAKKKVEEMILRN
jgi:restriction endonuclease S subunit